MFLIINKKLILLISGEFFGITNFKKNKWLVFQKTSKTGRIIELEIIEEKVISITTKIDNISKGCHQILYNNEGLFITDTYNNGILHYKFIKEKFVLFNSFYPNGSLINGRRSKNYSHINSIYKYKDFFILLFHNETTKTKKNSQIAITNNKFKIIKLIETKAGSAHDIYILNNKHLYCNTMQKTLILDNSIVYKANMLTRGLAVNNKYIVVGGSEYGKRELRNNLKGEIYILDLQFQLISTVTLQGMVQDIKYVK